MNKAFELLGLCMLATFAATDLTLAIVSKGALMYYYEPSKVIYAIELALGILGLAYFSLRLEEITTP